MNNVIDLQQQRLIRACRAAGKLLDKPPFIVCAYCDKKEAECICKNART